MTAHRIVLFGNEDDWEDPSEATPEIKTTNSAVDLKDYFKPVRLPLEVINQASKLIPHENWIKYGICKYLQHTADHMFLKLPSGKMEIRGKVLKYVFEFDHDGPVLKSISL
jgi:hypothetical protein